MTTHLPSHAELGRMISGGFTGTEKDYSQRIAVLKSLRTVAGGRLLDFGASWGYGTWQFRQAGFDAVGFETSKPRARFGREHLKLPLFDTIESVGAEYDVIFCAHVIEHMPRPSELFYIARHRLRKGGLLVAFMPNGTVRRLAIDRTLYNHSWGRLHPAYIDEEFCRRQAGDRPLLLDSRPYGGWKDLDAIAQWHRKSDLTLNLENPELLAVCAY